jgi:hypothetical protein
LQCYPRESFNFRKIPLVYALTPTRRDRDGFGCGYAALSLGVFA